jgi:hypothetical protein
MTKATSQDPAGFDAVEPCATDSGRTSGSSLKCGPNPADRDVNVSLLVNAWR